MLRQAALSKRHAAAVQPATNARAQILSDAGDTIRQYDDVDTIISRIHGLYSQNCAIISVIEELLEKTINCFVYTSPANVSTDGRTCTFELSTSTSTAPVRDIVRAWKDCILLEDVPDLFGFKHVMSCRDYNDLKRLNEEMLLAVRHCELAFDIESTQGREIVEKYLGNFEKINQALRLVQTLCDDQIPAPDSIIALLQQVNLSLAKASSMGCTFKR